MKLMCSIEIFNRLATLNANIGRKKLQRSCLTIGRQSIKNNEIYLLLQTQTNKIGTKYKVNNNIEKVFTKFVNEGKATIRIIEPPHDINIQSDAVQLKSFLHVLKLGLLNKLDVLNLSNLNPKNLTVALKTKTTIKNVSDYPVIQGFPRITEELHLAGLQRKSFDRQILKLQNLRILNLSENCLTSLPKELGTLPNLQELYLSNNQLGKSTSSKWSWLSGHNIAQSLRLLNLSSNELTVIPDQITKLYGLVSLYLNNNLIENLPHGIGRLCKLKFFNLSKNKLTYLSENMKRLQLSELDISENPFKVSNDNVSICYGNNMPKLIDFAMKVVLLKRIYYDPSIIPLTLVQFLDNAKFCMCGSPCTNFFINKYIHLNVSTIAHSVKFSGSARNHVLFDCYFCSTKCARIYTNISR